jgi:hypothetical protein
MDIVSIHYDDNKNSFDDDGAISGIIPIKRLKTHKKTGGIFYYKDSDDENITYKVIFPIRELDRMLYYYSQDNTFDDEDGNIMFNLFSLIPPNDLFMFKKNKKSVCLDGVHGGKISLIYF